MKIIKKPKIFVAVVAASACSLMLIGAVAASKINYDEPQVNATLSNVKAITEQSNTESDPITLSTSESGNAVEENGITEENQNDSLTEVHNDVITTTTKNNSCDNVSQSNEDCEITNNDCNNSTEGNDCFGNVNSIIGANGCKFPNISIPGFQIGVNNNCGQNGNQSQKPGNNCPSGDNDCSDKNDSTTDGNGESNNGGSSNGDSGNVGSNQSYADKVLSLVNVERAKSGLAPLTMDNTLVSAATVRANEIQTSFSHTRPDGRSCFTAMQEAGASYKTAGENIAYGQKTPEEVMNSWMNSEGHRKNIMSSSFTRLGVGYVKNSSGTAYWVQMFAN